MVHLKDFVMPGKKPAKMYELIGVEDTKQNDEDQTEKFELRPSDTVSRTSPRFSKPRGRRAPNG